MTLSKKKISWSVHLEKLAVLFYVYPSMNLLNLHLIITSMLVLRTFLKPIDQSLKDSIPNP